MSSSRPTFSSCCANGDASRARRDGCLPASPGCFPATAGSTSVRADLTAFAQHAPGALRVGEAGTEGFAITGAVIAGYAYAAALALHI